MWKWLQCRFLMRKDTHDNSNEDEHTNNNLLRGNVFEVCAEVEPDVNLIQEAEPSRITQLLKDLRKSDSFDRSPEQHSKISVKGRSSPTQGVQQQIVEKYVAQDKGEACLTFEAPCAGSSEAVQHQMNSADDTYKTEALSCVHQEETDPVLSSGVAPQTRNDGETQVVCNDGIRGSLESSEHSSERHSEIECVRDDLREIIQEPHSKGKFIVDFKETDHDGAFSTSGSFKSLRPSSSSGSLKSPRPSCTSGSLKSRRESVESTKEFEISTFVQHEGNCYEDRNEGLKEEEQMKCQSVTDKAFIECRNDAKVVRTFDEKYHADVEVSKSEIKNITCEGESRNGCRFGVNESALDFKNLEMPSKENVCNMSDKCFEEFNDNGSLSLLQNGQDITDIGSTVIHEVVNNVIDSRDVIEDNEEFCKTGNAHTSELRRISNSFPKELDTQQYSFALPSKVVSLVTSLCTESRELSVEVGGKKEEMCGYNESHASSFVSTSDDSALEGSGVQQDIKAETGEKENNGTLDANEVKLDPLDNANDILGAKQLPSSMFHGDTDPDYCDSKAQDQSVLEVNEERSQSEVSAGAQTTMITPESITCLHPYPCCSYLTCLYNQSGQICTILGQQFILTSVQESPVLVQVGLVNHLNLKYGCVFLWQDGTPQLLQTISDGTSVLFDAIALPNFKAFTALVIWQVAKPVLTTEAYLSNKYVFIKELKDLLVHTVSIKQNFGTFSVDIDGGTKILEFDFDVLFIDGEVATAEARAADILESGNPYFANIVKFLKRSATGAISHEFKCSLVWTGVKPTIETHKYKCSTYYAKDKESYSVSERQSWLLCDTESVAVISNGKYVVRYDVQGKEQSTPFKPESLYCGSKHTKVTDGIMKTKAHIRRHVAKSGKEVHQVMMVQILEKSLDNAKDSASKGEQKRCQDESLGADPFLCCERSETQENGCGENSLVASVTEDSPPLDSGLDCLRNRLNDKENLVVIERKDDHIEQVNDAQSKSVELFQNDNRDYQWEFVERANEVQLFDNQEDHVNKTEAKDSEVFMSDEECCSRESEDDFKGLQLDHEKYTKELKSKDTPVPHFVESWTNFPDSVSHLNRPYFNDFLPPFIEKEFDDKGFEQEAVIRGIGESSALNVKEIAKSSNSLDVTEVKCCVTGKDSKQLIGATSQSFEKNNSPNMAERMFENHMLSSELSLVTQHPLLLQSWPGLLYFEKDIFILYTKVNGLASDIMVSTVACVIRDGKLIKLEKDSPSQLVLFDAFYDHERCRYYVTVIWEGNLPQIVHALNAVYFYNVEGVYDRFVKKSKTYLVSLYGIKAPVMISGVNGVVSPEGKPVDWPPSPGTQLILHLRKLSTALCEFEWYANLIIVLSVENDRTVQFSCLDSNAKSLGQILSDKDSQLITSSSPQKCMADLDISQTSLRSNDVPCRTQKYYNFNGKLRRYLKDYVGTITFSDTGEEMIVSSIDGLEFWVRPCKVICDNGKVLEISKANVGLVVKYDAFCDDVKLPHKAELMWIGEKPGEIILEPNTKVLYDIRGIFIGTETTENTTDYSLILNLNGQQRLVKCQKSVRVILPDGNLFLEKLSHGNELCVYLEEKNYPILGTVQYIIHFLFILGKAETNHPLLLKGNFENFEQAPIYAQNLVASPGGFSATEKEEAVERKSLKSEEDFKVSSCETELYGEKVSERQSFSCKSKLIIDQQKSFEAVPLQDGDPDSGFLGSDSQCLFEGTKSQHRIKPQDPLSLPQDVNNEAMSCMDEHDIGRSVIADDLTNMMLIDTSDRSSVELNILPGEDPNDSEGDVIRGEALKQLISNCPKSVSQFFPVYVGCIQKEHINYSDFCFNHNGVSHVLHLPANLYHIVCGSDEVFRSPTYVFIRKEEEKNALETPVYHPILSWQGRRKKPLHVIRNQRIIVYNAADKLITLKSDQDKTMQSYILATERIVSRKGDFIVKENYSSTVNKDMLTFHAVVESVPEAFISGYFVCEKILFMSSSLYVLTAFLRSFTTNCVDNILDTNPPSSISSNDTSMPLSVMEMDTNPPLSVASNSASVPQIAVEGIDSVACSEILNAYRANKIDAARCKDGRTYHVFDVRYTEDPVNFSVGSLKRYNEVYGVIYSKIRNAFVLCDIANVFFHGKKITSFNDIDKRYELNINHIRVPLIYGIEVDGLCVDSLALMAWAGCEPGIFTIHECKSHETVLFTFEENRMIDSEFSFFTGAKTYDVLLGVPLAEQLSETCGILGAITVDELEARECKVGHNVYMLDDESLLESFRLKRLCGTVKQVFKDYIIFFCNELKKFVSCLKSRLVISLEKMNSLKILKGIKFTLICRCFTFMMRGIVIDFVAVLAFRKVDKLPPGIHICNIHPDVLLPRPINNKLAVGTSHSTAVDNVYEMSNQSAYHHLLGRQTAEFTEAVKINYYFDCSATMYHVECQGMLVKINDDDCTKGFVQVVIDGVSQNLAITREVLWGDLTKDMPLSTLIYSPLRIILRMSDPFGKKSENLKIVLAWREYEAINTPTTVEIGSCPGSVKLNGICCHIAFILSHFERSHKTSEFQVFTAYRSSKSSNNREEFLLMTSLDNSSQIVSCLEAFQVSIEDEIEKNKGPWQVLVSRPKDDKLIALLAWQGRICNLRMMVCNVHGIQPLDVKLEEGNYMANEWWDDTRLSCSRSGSYSSVATESSHPYEMERIINGNNWLQAKSSESISVMSTDVKRFDASQLRVSRSLEASSTVLCSKDIELGSSFPCDMNSAFSVLDPSVSPMHDFEKNFHWEGTDDLQNKFTHVEAPSEYIVNRDLSKPLLFNKVDTPTLTDDVGEEIFYSSSSSNGSMVSLIDQNPGTFDEMHEQSLSNDLFPTIGNTVLDNGLNQNSHVSHDKVFDCLEKFSQSDDEQTNHDSAVANVQTRKSNSLSVLVDQSFRGSESGHLKEGETSINANDRSVEKAKNESKSSNIEAKRESTSLKCRSENSLPTSDNSSIRSYSAAVKHPVHAPSPKDVMIHFEVMSNPVYATCTVFVSKRKFAILKGAGKVILLMAENMHVRKKSKCVDDLETLLSARNIGVHHVEVRQPANKKVLAISSVAVVAYLGKKPQSVKDYTDAWKRNCMKTLKLSKADVDYINSSIASLSSNNSCVSNNLETANNVPVKGKAKTDSETPSKIPINPSSSPSKKVKKIKGKPAKPFKVGKETGILEVEVSKGNILKAFFTKQVVYIHKKSIPSNLSLTSSMTDLKKEKWFCNAHPFPLKKGKPTRVVTGVEVQLNASLIWYGQKPSKEDIMESEREASAKSALKTKPSRLGNAEDRNSPNLRNGTHQESETAEWSQKQDNPASGAIKKRTRNRRKSKSDHSSSSKDEEHCQMGTIIELHQTVGCLLTSDEKSLYFSRDQCYLHGVCLVNVELNHVLSIGLEVSCEVKTSHQSVNKVWVGERQVLDERDLLMKLRMWCGYHQVPNKATNTLLLDAGWLPSDLEPMLNEADDRDVVNL